MPIDDPSRALPTRDCTRRRRPRLAGVAPTWPGAILRAGWVATTASGTSPTGGRRTCGAVSTTRTAPAFAATVKGSTRSCSTTTLPACSACARAHSGSSTTVRSSASSSTVMAAVPISSSPTRGARSFANAKTFSGTSGATGTIFSNNFHVACRVSGTVELDGRRAEVVDAPAWRDHSWGVRRWDSFVSSRSFGGSHGVGDDDAALPLRLHGRVQRELLPRRRAHRGRRRRSRWRRVDAGARRRRLHVLSLGGGPLRARGRGDDGRPHRHHRGHDRRDGATSRLGVGR